VAIRHADEEELRNLVRWLRDEDELRGRVALDTVPPRPDHMGGGLDAVTVMVTSGTASALVTSLFTWLASRRTVRRVNVTVEAPAGGKIAVECGSPDDAERLLQACREVLAGG
jgi:hypothetical protein